MAFAGDNRGATLSAEDNDVHYGRARRRVFLLSAACVALAGLLYTALQPAQYESTASVLMSAPTAIDEQMQDADVQGVAIQRRILTGSEITDTLSSTLTEAFSIDLSPLALRSVLGVRSIPDTNLLELTATGSEADWLPTVLERWIDVYTQIRARDIEERKSRTLAEVDDELSGLQQKLEDARTALAEFRQENEIISMERQENAVLSQLDGLNKALNRAVEEEVRSRAYLDTLRASLDAGEQVVPSGERSEVAAMARKLKALQSRLADLRVRYTEDYIRKDPRLREIPREIEDLEAALGRAYAEGSEAEMRNAERAWAAARQSVVDLETRLALHKDAVSEFNTIYATHQALVQDLARLEAVNRETQARQVQIEVRREDRYPQVAVIDWPAAQATRIGPPYALLLGGTALAALLVGIFAVWLYSYLHPRQTAPAFVTLSGVHMYPQDAAALDHLTPQAPRLSTSEVTHIADQSADEQGSNGNGSDRDTDDDGGSPSSSR